MPSKTSRKRLLRVAARLHSRPVPARVTAKAFEHFRVTGELPDDPRIGDALLKRIRTGIEVVESPNGDVDWGATIASSFTRQPRAEDEVMDRLIEEALYAEGIVRSAAREVLMAFARAGLDVTSALFAGKARPEHGSVGMQLLGFPDRLARRPYVRQIQRLIRRAERVRREVEEADHRWSDDLRRAAECFQLHGHVPRSPRMLEAVLILGEMNTFMRNAAGEDVRDLLALFDAIATKQGAERQQYIDQLVEMGQSGALRDDGA